MKYSGNSKKKEMSEILEKRNFPKISGENKGNFE